MISPEVIRRYPFFAGLTHEHIVALAHMAEEVTVENDHYFFREGDDLKKFHLILEGKAAVVIGVPDQSVKQKVSSQLTGRLETRDVVLSTLGRGDAFGWSSLVPPYQATASTKAITPCRVVVFDAVALRRAFKDDCRFGYLVMQKAVQISSSRLHDLRIETLTHIVE